MGRPSKLTEKQWAEIERRRLSGETPRALSKEFGIAESAIRAKISAQVKEIKSVAEQIVAAETRFSALPVSAQVSARSLADELKAISFHLASAAKFGSMTAHKLSSIANVQAERIDETANLDDNSQALQSVMAMTKGANDAAAIGLNLLNANKDRIKAIDADDMKVVNAPAVAIFRLPDNERH